MDKPILTLVTNNAAPAKPATNEAALPSYVTGIECLSFVKKLPRKVGGRDYWAVPNLDNHSMEWKLGEALGWEALAFMRRFEGPGSNNPPYLLASIGGSMIKRGVFGGTEMGFFRAISCAIVDGRLS
jgi:hypothetical protein